MELVAEWKASGETAREFGAPHGIGSEMLYRWAEAERKTKKENVPAFIQVQSAGRRRVGAVEIVLAGGRVVVVREAVDAELLLSVVEALESAC